MPPRPNPRGGPAGRGGVSGPAIRGNRGNVRGGGPSGVRIGLPNPNAHITTVGVMRPNFGTGGRELPIFVNSFQTTIPEDVIHHYDGKLTTHL
jgi:eukaryotic translation initiation factor 2C